ncbi:MAG: two pore domain potassium channel family protein, partial [Coxiellaceae bacterium]|nr:two pore domain potassium channel family protein [Coxiellaceae bacterium]
NAFAMNTDHANHFAVKQSLTYFSYVTLSTLGYGDIVPLSAPARTFAWLEAITGQGYLTILIAQVVGQFIAQKKDSSS